MTPETPAPGSEAAWLQEYLQPTKEGSEPYVTRALALLLRMTLSILSDPGPFLAIAERLFAHMRELHPLSDEDAVAGGTAFVDRLLFDGQPACESITPQQSLLGPGAKIRFSKQVMDHSPVDISTCLYLTLYRRICKEHDLNEDPVAQVLFGDDVLEMSKRLTIDMERRKPNGFAPEPGRTVH